MTITKRRYGNYDVSLHHIQTAHNGCVALTHLPANAAEGRKGVLVLTPGMFSNRRFWLSDKGIGLAAYLSDNGFDCWMFERRGLGDSDKSHDAEHSLFHTFEHDLPAVQQYLATQGVSRACYMGHSFGGVLNALSLAKGHLQAEGVSGLVTISSQLTVGKRLLNKPYSAVVYAITAVLGHFPAKSLGMGPENESSRAMRDCCRLVAWAKDRDSRKANFWHGFDDIRCPVLGIGSDGDTVDPAEGCKQLLSAMGSQQKTFIQLGKKQGHRQDYDHVGMVVSKDAQQEVWPLLLAWLEGQRA